MTTGKGEWKEECVAREAERGALCQWQRQQHQATRHDATLTQNLSLSENAVGPFLGYRCLHLPGIVVTMGVACMLYLVIKHIYYFLALSLLDRDRFYITLLTYQERQLITQ